MEVFDRIDSSIRQINSPQQALEWRPKTKLEQEAITRLTAVENRSALKIWYGQFPTINPTAEIFRQILERFIGEELPLKTSDTPI